MHLQPVSNIAEIFSQKGIQHVVISPGSRNAPLTLAFARHPKIETYVVPDERSAGFVALGISQNLKRPVGVICTSGTASANLFPAVAEAFFQDTPLLVMTADRPPEWIDQWDGQTIYQENIYGRHVKESFNLPVDLTKESAVNLFYQQISEGINIATSLPYGPVHFNLPFREPFYPEKGEEITFDEKIAASLSPQNKEERASPNWIELKSKWNSFERKLILIGQNELSRDFNSILQDFSKQRSIPVLGDVISNIHNVEDIIGYSDTFLASKNREKLNALVPDLLITFGKSVISKNLKLFLRSADIKEHWHIQYGEKIRDPFSSSPKIINSESVGFLKEMYKLTDSDSFMKQKQKNFYELWQIAERSAKELLDEHLKTTQFGEWKASFEIVQSLPSNSNFHLANSMPVRLANYCGLSHHQEVEVFANRGTSGIDGCTSTAMGFAINSQKPVILLTGDMAFLYDRNAFWHNYSYPKLRIVVLNNHGGGIFRLIKGPSDHPELEEYFETRQPLKAEPVALEYGLEYHYASTEEDLKRVWKEFFNFDGKAKLLEIETNPKINQQVFEEFRTKTETLL